MSSGKVSEVMSRRVMEVQALDRLVLARKYMAWGGFRHLPVMRGARLVGVLSERDLLRHLAEHDGRPGDALVQDAMTTPAVTVTPRTPTVDAVRQMVGSRIGCLPVVEGGLLLGILTTTDVLLDQVRRSER